MGKQLLGGLVMFLAIRFTAVSSISFENAVFLPETEVWKKILWYSFKEVSFLFLFCIFFVGLKVFAVGLRREWVEQASGSGPVTASEGDRPTTDRPVADPNSPPT